MEETQNSSNWDSWMMARLGFAIDATVDRIVARPTLGYDPAQAYGMDEQGRLYQLGQTNAHVSATVNNTGGAVALNPLMLLLIIGAIVVASK